MARKKKPTRQPLSVTLFVVLMVLVCAAYEPVSGWLKGEAPSGQLQGRPADTNQKRLSDLPAQGSGLELPESLKGTRSELILKRMGYTVSYNMEWNLPNWVAWELNADKLVEREGRSDHFLPDPDLMEHEAVTTDDYKGSGWDRGHMCPAGDNRWHWKAMQESFYMTNICPQDHNLNRGDWKELEEKCRVWAKEEGPLYIVCGPILYNRKHQTIGKEHTVVVPEAFFKVVLSMGGDRPKAAGFIFKNSPGNRKLESYMNSIAEVERITGINFFPRLPDDLEQEVEAMKTLVTSD